MARSDVAHGRREGAGGVRTRGRVLITKLGLDGHDVGAKFVAHTLRESGFEVIYLGIRQSPESVAATAIAEDVEAIGVSILSGAHVRLATRLLALLPREPEQDRIDVLLGGVVPAVDRQGLYDVGVAKVLDASTSPAEIVAAFDAVVRRRQST